MSRDLLDQVDSEMSSDLLDQVDQPRVVNGVVVVDRESQWDHRDLLPALKAVEAFVPFKLNHFSRIFTMIYEELRMKLSRRQEHDAVTSDLESILKLNLSNHSRLELFGSSVNGFGSNECDLDLCLTFNDNVTGEGIDTEGIIGKIADILNKHGPIVKESILAITTAKVPIVKFVYDLKGKRFNCDISLYNVLAKSNTSLLRAYTQIDPRVSILGFIVKYWAKVCEIGDASKGSLSSYAYTLMTLHYLQHARVIPVLQEILPPGITEKPDIKVDQWNVYFFQDIASLKPLCSDRANQESSKPLCSDRANQESLKPLCSGRANQESIASLFFGFLDFYSQYDFEERAISCRQISPLSKEEKEKSNWRWKLINIEDPFLLDHNLGQGLTNQMGVYIRSAFIMSRNHLAKILADTSPIPPNAAPDHQSKIFFNHVRLTPGKVPTGRGCRNCGGIGHKRDQCPNPKKEQKTRACFQCGDPSHLIYDCPERYRLERMRQLDRRFKQPINHSSNYSNHRSMGDFNRNDNHRHHNNINTLRATPNQRRIQPHQSTPRSNTTNNNQTSNQSPASHLPNPFSPGSTVNTGSVTFVSPQPASNSTESNASVSNSTVSNVTVSNATVSNATVSNSTVSNSTVSVTKVPAMKEKCEMSTQTTRDDYEPRKPKDGEKKEEGDQDDHPDTEPGSLLRESEGGREKKTSESSPARIDRRGKGSQKSDSTSSSQPSLPQPSPSQPSLPQQSLPPASQRVVQSQAEPEIHPLLQKLLLTPSKPGQPTFGTPFNQSSSPNISFNQQQSQNQSQPRSQPVVQNQLQPSSPFSSMNQPQSNLSFLNNFGSSLGHQIQPSNTQSSLHQTNQQHNQQQLANNSPKSRPSMSMFPPSMNQLEQQPVSSYPPMLDLLFNRHPSPSTVTPPRLLQQQQSSPDPHLFLNRNNNRYQQPRFAASPSSFPKLPGQQSPVKNLFGNESGSKSALDSINSDTRGPSGSNPPPGFNKVVASGPVRPRQDQQHPVRPGRYRPAERVGHENEPLPLNGPGERSKSPHSVVRGRGRAIWQDGRQ